MTHPVRFIAVAGRQCEWDCKADQAASKWWTDLFRCTHFLPLGCQVRCARPYVYHKLSCSIVKADSNRIRSISGSVQILTFLQIQSQEYWQDLVGAMGFAVLILLQVAIPLFNPCSAWRKGTVIQSIWCTQGGTSGIPFSSGHCGCCRASANSFACQTMLIPQESCNLADCT